MDNKNFLQVLNETDPIPTLNVLSYRIIGTLCPPSGTSTQPMEYVAPSWPLTWKCRWCGGHTSNDKYGHCIACGGPREEQWD